MTITSGKMSSEEMIPFTAEIKVRSCKESVAFYTEKLDFEVLRIDEKGGFATLVFNGGQFLIQEEPSVPDPKGVGVFFRFFVTKDIKIFHNELTAKGVKILKPLKEMDYGLIRFYIEDLDGYQIKFVQSVES
jgi:predicted enzyme related to lactoylglutathione lyase